MSRVVFIAVSVSVLALAGLSSSANATSGPGCLRVVNVAGWDTLNMRSGPSARNRIIDRLSPRGHGIIKLNGKCIPLAKRWRSRWCPVTHYNGDRTTSGWLKARYVRDNECP